MSDESSPAPEAPVPVPAPSASPDGAPGDAPAARSGPTPALWVERERTRVYRAHNARGAEVRIGPAEVAEAFTPGELLKVALAGCTGMSTDHRLAKHLGEDYELVIGVSGASDHEENRYRSLELELVLSLAGLDEEERTRLVERAEAAAHRLCTVGRTLAAGAEYTMHVTDES
ncbi:OsmC family protein [Georgenia sp. 10Sc9-8]|uniref:OsmC family protein n=1 Tax=Georgenia halotolerans TaxID=3028317 RepID=A0ABT5U1I9_9MICO|nr:OsmC family protein [Georgenia halotolerans]